MGNKFDLDALKAENFIGAPRTHVEKAYLLMTGEPAESIEGRDLEELRGTCQQLNTLTEIVKAAPKEAPIQTSSIGKIPNLGPHGAWEGRKRRVTVHNPFPPESLHKAFSIGWEGVNWYVLFDQPVDMPWPYWEALRNAIRIDKDSVKAVSWVKDEATGQLDRVSNAIKTPVYHFTDHGDVPGTEGLPQGYIEFFRDAARRTSVFRDSKPALLLLAYAKLFDGPPTDKNHQNVQLDHTALRVRIAERLGTEFVNLLNEEIYTAA